MILLAQIGIVGDGGGCVNSPECSTWILAIVGMMASCLFIRYFTKK